jgi:hypothetical protein
MSLAIKESGSPSDLKNVHLSPSFVSAVIQFAAMAA